MTHTAGFEEDLRNLFLATGAAGWAAWAQWRHEAGTRWVRIRTTAAVTVALLFAWSLHYWNLLGWRP